MSLFPAGAHPFTKALLTLPDGTYAYCEQDVYRALSGASPLFKGLAELFNPYQWVAFEYAQEREKPPLIDEVTGFDIFRIESKLYPQWVGTLAEERAIEQNHVRGMIGRIREGEAAAVLRAIAEREIELIDAAYLKRRLVCGRFWHALPQFSRLPLEERMLLLGQVSPHILALHPDFPAVRSACLSYGWLSWAIQQAWKFPTKWARAMDQRCHGIPTHPRLHRRLRLHRLVWALNDWIVGTPFQQMEVAL